MEEPQEQPVCILVADSDVLVRHAISDYLRDCGYWVAEAATSDEAQTILEGAGLPVSAVLCDARIKGTLNGFELRRWVNENCGSVQTVIAGKIEAVASAAAEICDEGPHLRRPYDPQGVVDYIKRLLAKGRSEER